MERVVYEQMAEVADRHWWFRARREILRTVIKRLAEPQGPLKILEIGCGTGHNLGMLAEFGEVEGLEIDEEARVLARSRTDKGIGGSALPELVGVERNRYDLIALLDVLEHINDDEASLRTISQCLKSGGHLLLTVPAHSWMWTAHDEMHHHKRRYSKRELTRVLNKAGFKIQTITFFNFFLFPLVAATRIAGRITGRHVSDDKMPPRPLNALLETIFGAERYLVGRVPLPTGVSLLALARRR